MLKFFNASVYEKYNLMNTLSEDIRRKQLMNWSALKLKKSYFQD